MNFVLSGKRLLPFILFCSLAFLTGLLFYLEFSSLERVLLPFFISLFISLGIFSILTISCKDKFCPKIYIISVIMHFIFILFWQIFKYHLLGYQTPTENIFRPYTVDNDGALYHQYGVHIANNFSMEILKEKLAGGLFPKLVGTIYYLFGINPFIVSCLNAIISGFTATILFLIGKLAFKNRAIAKIFSFLAILNFAHIINTSTMIRDNYIVLFMYLSILTSYYFYKNRNILSLSLTLVSIYGIYLFRPYAAFIILFAFLTTFLLLNIKTKIQNGKVKINKLALIIYVLSPIIIGGIFYLIGYFASYMKVLSVEDLIAIRDVAYVGGDSDMGMDFGALYSKFFLLPFIIGYFCLFFAPFPWEWMMAKRLIYVPDMLILYCFLPSFFKNIKKVFTDKNYFLIICFCSILFMFSIYCITLGNSGAIHRLRGPFIPMIYLIAMYAPDKFLSKIIEKIKQWRII